ncbi:MAG TPA: adenylate/guanylate cyclase domain-containing protein, partial [Casimicrobiaceae bacterium]|nr:adenylate/guanylate cyclase domain-containing protein [Casimicrobiaceae bacterium]
GGSIATMRRQLKLIARALPEAATLLATLRAPDVVAFAGHMLDAPGRAVARFPAALVPAVDAALRAHVARWHAPVVFGSAASGADLILLEAALEAGAEVNVVLPFDRADFVRTSVAPGGADWVARFDRVLARASRIVASADGDHLGDDALFTHAAREVEGLAVLRAAQLETVPTMLCVLDPGSDGASGGTLESFERWRRNLGTPDVIDLRALREAARTAAAEGPVLPKAPVLAGNGADARRSLKSLLFADIAGYGRLTDRLVPQVQRRFWSIAAQALASSASAPRFANTWGDGLYVVFDSPRDGAAFALGLADAMSDEAWAAVGQSGVGAIRVALHTGPVYVGHDPVVGRDNYFGASVTRTARIEPITPPGSVYASEAFAASLAADGSAGFLLEYVGRLDLAKGYGEARIYRVERA